MPQCAAMQAFKIANTKAIIQALRMPGFAVDFALRNLEPYEIPRFLQDWQNGADLEEWLAGLVEDLAVPTPSHTADEVAE